MSLRLTAMIVAIIVLAGCGSSDNSAAAATATTAPTFPLAAYSAHSPGPGCDRGTGVTWQTRRRPVGTTFSCRGDGFQISFQRGSDNAPAFGAVVLMPGVSYPEAYKVSVSISLSDLNERPLRSSIYGQLDFGTGDNVRVYTDYCITKPFRCGDQPIYGWILNGNEAGDTFSTPTAKVEVQVNQGDITVFMNGEQVTSFGGASSGAPIVLEASLQGFVSQGAVTFSDFTYTPM